MIISKLVTLSKFWSVVKKSLMVSNSEYAAVASIELKVGSRLIDTCTKRGTIELRVLVELRSRAVRRVLGA